MNIKEKFEDCGGPLMLLLVAFAIALSVATCHFNSYSVIDPLTGRDATSEITKETLADSVVNIQCDTPANFIKPLPKFKKHDK